MEFRQELTVFNKKLSIFLLSEFWILYRLTVINFLRGKMMYSFPENFNHKIFRPRRATT